MTKFRKPIASAALACALAAASALSAGAAHAHYNKIALSYAATKDGKSFAPDLPPPPTVAAPQPQAPGQDFQVWRKNLSTSDSSGQGQTTTIGGMRTISVGGAQAPKPGASPMRLKAR
jgi:hypothetical protein